MQRWLEVSNILILYGLNIFVLVWALFTNSELYGVQRWIHIVIHHKYLHGCNEENSYKSIKFYNETFSSVTLTPQTDISAHQPVFTTADFCQTKQHKFFLWPIELKLQVTSSTITVTSTSIAPSIYTVFCQHNSSMQDLWLFTKPKVNKEMLIRTYCWWTRHRAYSSEICLGILYLLFRAS